MKNKTKINLFISSLMFLNMAFIAGLGFTLKYLLPPGREQAERYGENVELRFLGMDRHEWGAIHLIAGFILLLRLYDEKSEGYC